MSETIPLSSSSRGEPELPQVLRVDAFTCAAMGLLLVAAATPLSGWLGLPEPLLFWAGVVLFPCALLMLLAARRPRFGPLVGLIVLGNFAWVAASAVVAAVFSPTTLGLVFVLVQAAVVAVLAWLEWRGLRST
jgi:hypothetical protein